MPVPVFHNHNHHHSDKQAETISIPIQKTVGRELLQMTLQDGTTKSLKLPTSLLSDLEFVLNRQLNAEDAKDILTSPSMVACIEAKLNTGNPETDINKMKKITLKQCVELFTLNGVKENRAMINGVDTFFIEAGDSSKETVLFIHGGVGSSSYKSWKYQFLELSEKYHVISPDLPGYGKSPHPHDKCTLNFYVKFVKDFMVNRGIESANVISSSMGGWIGLGFTLENPSMVNKLVGTASGGLTDREIPLTIRELTMFPKVAKFLLTRLHKNKTLVTTIAKKFNRGLPVPENVFELTDMFFSSEDVTPAFMEFLNDQFSASPKEVLSDLFGKGKDKKHKEVLRGFKNVYMNGFEVLNSAGIPYWIAHGDNDLVFQLPLVKAAAKNFEHCTLTEFKCGHGPHLQVPNEFNPLLLKFLESQPEETEKRKKFKDVMLTIRNVFKHS